MLEKIQSHLLQPAASELVRYKVSGAAKRGSRRAQSRKQSGGGLAIKPYVPLDMAGMLLYYLYHLLLCYNTTGFVQHQISY